MRKRIMYILGVFLTLVCVPMGVNASTVDISTGTDKIDIDWDPNVEVTKQDDVYYVKLTGDVAQDFIIKSGEDVVLDLNGHKFLNFTEACEALKVLEGGKLTIKDSVGTGVVTQKEASTYSAITNLGTLVIESGNFETTQNFYVVRNEGNLTINGGNFKSTSNTSLIGNIKYVNDEGVVVTKGTPVMTINNGIFTATSNAVKNGANCVVTIAGGTLTSTNAFALDNLADATVTGGTLTSVNNSAIRNQVNVAGAASNSLKVSGATLSSAEGKSNYSVYDEKLGKDVTDNYVVVTDEDGNQTVIEKVVEEKPNTDTTTNNGSANTTNTNVTNPKTGDINLLVILSLIGASVVGLRVISKKIALKIN